MRLTSVPTMLVFLSLGAVACKDAAAPRIAATLDRAVGDNQRAFIGQAVPRLLSVVVRDKSGAPLDGVVVRFNVTSGGGSITGGETISGPDGIATSGAWALGSSAGSNTVLVTSGGASLEFHAEAVPVPLGTFTLVTVNESPLPFNDQMIFLGVVLSGTITLNDNATYSEIVTVRDDRDVVTVHQLSGRFLPGSPPDRLQFIHSDDGVLEGNALNIYMNDGEFTFSEERFTFMRVSS